MARKGDLVVGKRQILKEIKTRMGISFGEKKKGKWYIFIEKVEISNRASLLQLKRNEGEMGLNLSHTGEQIKSWCIFISCQKQIFLWGQAGN